jgi:hypothetical protein
MSTTQTRRPAAASPVCVVSTSSPRYPSRRRRLSGNGWTVEAVRSVATVVQVDQCLAPLPLMVLLRGEAALAESDSPYTPGSGHTVPAGSGQAFPLGRAGTIEVHCRALLPLPGWWPLSRPRIIVDGQLERARWGLNTWFLPAGPHHVEVFIGEDWRNQSSNSVTVFPDQTVRLEYKTPIVQYAAGSLGPAPQPRNGTWPVWPIVLGLIAFSLWVVIAAV